MTTTNTYTHMKALTILLCILAVAFCSLADDKTGKPKLKVTYDGFPSGHDTPEGAACDLVRAFIKHDAALFTNTCIRLYAGGKGPSDYAAFLQSTVESMKAEAARKDAPPRGPKSIGKVFVHTSRGPGR